MTPNFQQRCSSLVQTLKENNLGAAAFVPGPNFYFLTGLVFTNGTSNIDVFNRQW